MRCSTGAGRLTAFVMSTLMASTRAFRPVTLRLTSRDRSQLTRHCRGRHYLLLPCCHRTSSGGRSSTRSPVNLQQSVSLSMLGVDAGFGLAGISALGALRLFTSTVVTPKRVRVVTDIDDTVKSSGNKRLFGVPLGGIDAQYNRGVFYPGVFQFSLELSRYRVPSWQEPLSVAVLTARAREFLFALEIGDTHEISKQFRLCGGRNGLKSWGRGPVLYGSVKEWICPSRKSERKAKNFGFLLEDDGQGGRRRPSGTEAGYIFIGDTGEGDPLAGEIMISKYPDRMKAVFLHVVSDAPRQGKVSVPLDRVVNGVPVVYFRTYVGAAARAVELGLMDKSGLNNVVTAAKQAMVKIPPKSSKWVDMNRDLLLARRAVERQQLPSMGIETLTLSQNGALAQKTKAKFKRSGTPAASRSRRRSSLVATATKTRP